MNIYMTTKRREEIKRAIIKHRFTLLLFGFLVLAGAIGYVWFSVSKVVVAFRASKPA